MIRQHTQVVVGLIVPTRQNASEANAELAKCAHWTCTHIRDDELAASQLPAMIRLHNKAVHKPLSWYPRPDLLVPVYEEAAELRDYMDRYAREFGV